MSECLDHFNSLSKILLFQHQYVLGIITGKEQLYFYVFFQLEIIIANKDASLHADETFL